MYNRKRMLVAATGLAACASVAVAAAAAPVAAAVTAPVAAHVAAPRAVQVSDLSTEDCRIEQLPTPAGTWRSDVTAGDPTGTYLVGEAAVRTGSDATIVALLWVDGRLTRFQPPASSTLVDVSASGAVVGFSGFGTASFAWRYRNGRFARLPSLRPTDATRPVAINGRGDVVGYSIPTADSFPGDMVLWPADRPATVRTIQVPGPTTVIDIDDDGTIVGMGSGPEPTTQRSYRWRPGGAAQPVRGPSGAADVGVVSIRNGWITGYENTFPVKAFAYDSRGGGYRQVTGLGAPYSGNGRGDIGVSSAIVHRDGRVVALPGLGVETAQAPRALSDRGRAAGFANDGSQVHAVRWDGC